MMEHHRLERLLLIVMGSRYPRGLHVRDGVEIVRWNGDRVCRLDDSRAAEPVADALNAAPALVRVAIAAARMARAARDNRPQHAADLAEDVFDELWELEQDPGMADGSA